MVARAVHQLLYTVEEAVTLQNQLSKLFSHGGFSLRKWNSNSKAALQTIPKELKDTQVRCTVPESLDYTKTLGVELNTDLDHF